MKWRPIIFGIIILICIVSINYAIYWMIKEEKEEVTKTPEVSIDLETILSQFNSIFDNTIDYQDMNVGTVSKKDSTKEVVYTQTQVTEKLEGQYELNVNIPSINISKNTVDDINEQIQQIFYSKVSSLMANSGNIAIDNQEKQNNKVNTTVYNVQYKAYINSNILSLIIKANLKEGTNEQRTLIKTYNYNLTTNEEIKLNQLREIKGITVQAIEKKIQETIKEANQQASNLESLGYKVLYRDATDEIYNIEKSNDGINCFLGEDGILYIIYPYGNRENTSEMDVILFQ